MTQNTQKGRLIMAANHIGSYLDTPPRALKALAEAHMCIFESKDGGRQFLKQAGLNRDFFLYSEHKEEATLEQAKAHLKKAETVFYASDQGCPNLADPGRDLLTLAYSLGAKVQVIPGPSSITSALSVCPFDITSYLFLGFPPQKTEKRLAYFRSLAKKAYQCPLVILDAPYRLKALLSDLAQVFPGKQKIFLALSISLDEEEYITGSSFVQMQEKTAGIGKKNFVLILKPHSFS